MSVYLAKRPKVKSYVLTKTSFSEITPLILRFKLDTGICTDFVQIFVDRLGGTAVLGRHYTIGLAESLRVIKTPEPSSNLKTFSFVISAEQLWFDLYLYPIVDYTQCEDKTIVLRVLNSKDYNKLNKDIFLKIGRSRIISLGNSFGLKNSYVPRLGEYINYGENIDHPPELHQGLYAEYEPAEGFISEPVPDIDPDISLLINYDQDLFPGLSSVSPIVEFVAPGYALSESGNAYSDLIEVKRTGDLSAVTMFRVDIVGGSASLGTDYFSIFPLYMTFAPGQSTLKVPISIIEDLHIDSGENVIFGLSPHINSQIGLVSTALLTIT